MPLSAQSKDVCVFAFPEKITFYADDVSTYKQILTINNPHGGLVDYIIKCNAPKKYSIQPCEGSIKNLNAQDVIVRHKAVIPQNIGITDIARIELLTSRERRKLGSKDIALELLSTKPLPQHVEPLAAVEELDRLGPSKFDGKCTHSKHCSQCHSHMQCGSSLNVIACWVALVLCAAVLCIFPSETEADERFPMFMHLHNRTRMVFSFFLGLILMYIFQLRSA